MRLVRASRVTELMLGRVRECVKEARRDVVGPSRAAVFLEQFRSREPTSHGTSTRREQSASGDQAKRVMRCSRRALGR
jgi:hypothetical protein